MGSGIFVFLSQVFFALELPEERGGETLSK